MTVPSYPQVLKSLTRLHEDPLFRSRVRCLIASARQLPSPATYATLFGLLAVTGLRISEALALNPADVDGAEGVLTIRRTKFGKSRLTVKTSWYLSGSHPVGYP